MNSKNFERCTNEMIERCLDTLLSKSKEYANDEDRLRAFRAAGAIEKTHSQVALGGMMAKHIVSIYDMLPNYMDYSIDKWDEKIGDTINYLLLLNALLREELCGYGV